MEGSNCSKPGRAHGSRRKRVLPQVWPWQGAGVSQAQAGRGRGRETPSAQLMRECQGGPRPSGCASEPDWQSSLSFLSNLPSEISSCCREGTQGF